MNPKELRIGNLVEYSDGGGYTELSGIAIHSFDCGILQIKPIELTEEWLIKFGFKFKNGYGYKFKFGYISRPDKYWMYHGIIIQIKYVHQLQNLYFALTGEELELNQ